MTCAKKKPVNRTSVVIFGSQPHYLNNGVQTTDHVTEHLLFLGWDLRDQTTHLAGLWVGHTESVTQLRIFINNARPWEQM